MKHTVAELNERILRSSTALHVTFFLFFSTYSGNVRSQESPPADTAEENSVANKDNLESETQWVAEPSPAVDTLSYRSSSSKDENEGPRYILEKIVIHGNKKTLRQVILRYIDILPGEEFSADDQRLAQAKYRLLASGLFHDVQLSLGKGTIRGRAILNVTVHERNTIVVQDVVLGFSEISKFYGSLDVAERSFLGTSVKLSAAAVFSQDGQWGYRLRLHDDHFLDSPFGVHVEGLFADARDFFGKDNVCVEASNEAIANKHQCSGSTETGARYQKSVEYAVLAYRRAGLRLGTGYAFLKDNYFTLDYRAEVIAADVPKAGYHYSFGEYRPIEFGHLLWGHSFLSSLIIGLTRDTRDSITLTSEGARTALAIELSSELIGSDYDFAKFTLMHNMYFKVAKTHTLGLGLFGGLIMGDSPFFNQFFVGDFSAFIPSRVLEMNFSHLQPNLLGKTIIREMRYEDIAAAANLEYVLPFYRGHGAVYGVNGFVSFGVFFLASKEHLKYDPKGYSGYQLVPIDITADIGIKVDTRVGLFIISLANLLRLIPGQGAAEE
jgi:outer membrane protein assembly factor BamA